ncbi:hypothetical protein [Methylobacterium sp. P5_C11]
MPGRPISLDRLDPGGCYLIAGQDGPDLALLVTRDGRREALLLNRRDGEGHLRIVAERAADAEVLVLQRAFVVPSGALADSTFVRDALPPAALHLAEGCAYLRGRDASGHLATFEVGSGRARAIDLADLPQARCWRVMVPEGRGVVTVYEAKPA